MCISCGCDSPGSKMTDSSITAGNLADAAANAGISPVEAAQNILMGAIKLYGTDATKTVAEAGQVLKADPEKRYLLTVAYPANKADVAVAMDGHRDFAAPDVVEKAAWDFLRGGGKLGLWHEAGHESTEVGEVVESYIWRGEPWVMKAADGTTQTVMAGDWLVGIVCTPTVWDLYKSGDIGGVSPQGRARRRKPTAEALAQLRS